MSKFLSIYLPSAGGAALVLGLSYGISARWYQDDTIASLQTQIAQKDANVESATAQSRALDAQLAEVVAERDSLAQIAAQGGGLTEPAPTMDAVYNLGREALPEEIAAWDVDVLPDGRGLPEGSGDVWTGEEVFVEYCASCHGDFAEGVGNWPVLAGGFDTLANEDPVKTVGSYWPYLSTVWDYVHRSMPFGSAGTLTADETYAIVAYILFSNNLVDDDFVLSRENFTDVEMYNTAGFIVDDRAETEYAQWSGEPCMADCKESVEITLRSSVLGVTPEIAEVDDGTTPTAASTEAPDETEMVEVAAEPAVETADQSAPDPALVAAGEGVFRQCRSCHQVGENARNGTGPALNGVVGRTIGAVDGFRYSNVMQDANAAGDVWDADVLSAYLADPRGAMPGTKMSFRGLRGEDEIAAIIAYLQSFEAQ